MPFTLALFVDLQDFVPEFLGKRVATKKRETIQRLCFRDRHVSRTDEAQFANLFTETLDRLPSEFCRVLGIPAPPVVRIKKRIQHGVVLCFLILRRVPDNSEAVLNCDEQVYVRIPSQLAHS